MGSSMANLCRLLIPLLLPLLIWGNSPTSEKERQKEKTNTKSEVAEVDEKDASEAPMPPQDSSPSSDYQTNRRRRKKDTWNVDCERRFTHGAPCTTGPYQKYAGRCCAATCLKLRSWIRHGCKKPFEDTRGF